MTAGTLGRLLPYLMTADAAVFGVLLVHGLLKGDIGSFFRTGQGMATIAGHEVCMVARAAGLTGGLMALVIEGNPGHLWIKIGVKIHIGIFILFFHIDDIRLFAVHSGNRGYLLNQLLLSWVVASATVDRTGGELLRSGLIMTVDTGKMGCLLHGYPVVHGFAAMTVTAGSLLILCIHKRFVLFIIHVMALFTFAAKFLYMAKMKGLIESERLPDGST